MLMSDFIVYEKERGGWITGSRSYNRDRVLCVSSCRAYARRFDTEKDAELFAYYLESDDYIVECEEYPTKPDSHVWTTCKNARCLVEYPVKIGYCPICWNGKFSITLEYAASVLGVSVKDLRQIAKQWK